ncbi:MAG: hypothetical protein Q8940_19090 [Bacteroidota bacterium]|nr:hypothetical protein [Bacteroidota bacterium]
MRCLKSNSCITIALVVILFAILGLSSDLKAQTCGFGCLGLGGFYGGYTVQKYEPNGLNDFIHAYNNEHSATLKEKMKDFGSSAAGFRVGANIFRTRSSHLFFSIKGFYQYLKEEHELKDEVSPGSVLSTTYTLDLNYYGLGLDLGVILGKRVDLKVIDAQVTFHSADFQPRTSAPDNKINDSDFENEKTVTGFTIGSGLIVHIIPDYVSLEATAGYTKFSFDQLRNDSNANLENSFDTINNFIKNGGLTATIQLNVGIPLY